MCSNVQKNEVANFRKSNRQVFVCISRVLLFAKQWCGTSRESVCSIAREGDCLGFSVVKLGNCEPIASTGVRSCGPAVNIWGKVHRASVLPPQHIYTVYGPYKTKLRHKLQSDIIHAIPILTNPSQLFVKFFE